MAGIQFKNDATAVLRRVEAEVLSNPRPVLKAIGVRLLREVDDIFRAQGRPAWAPMKPSTVAGKRQGRGSGSPRLLAGLRNTFDMALTGAREVTVFTRDPRAMFHEFGTKGPYEIRPKTAKALALPFLPGRDSGKGTAGTGKAGRFSLSGLGRSRQREGGGFLTPAGAKRVAYTNVSFRKKVTHPGLPARPMLPSIARAQELVRREVEAFVAFIARKRGG